MSWFVATGFVGLDYGAHWDEWFQVAGVRSCVERLELFPREYSYGGPYFHVGHVVVLLHTWEELRGVVHEVMHIGPASPKIDVQQYASIRRFQEKAFAFIDSEDYKLQTRAGFLLITALSLLWVWLTLRVWLPERPWIATAGMAFMALSWEVATHARFIAIDAPLMQFVALSLYLASVAWRSRHPVATRRALFCAAAAGGAALACKVTAVLVLGPLLIVPFLHRGLWRGLHQRAFVAVGMGWVACLPVLVMNPGTFLDPIRWLGWHSFLRVDYNSSGPGYPHYVDVPWEHLARLLSYFAFGLGSFSLPIAALFFCVACVGVVVAVKRAPLFTLPWLAWAAFFVVTLAMNRLFIVRNYLMLVPLVALSFAIGVGKLDEVLAAHQRARPALPAILALLFSINAAWLGYTAWTIPSTSAEGIRAEALAYVRAEGARFFVSPALYERMKSGIDGAFVCEPAGARAADAELVLLRFADHDARAWLSGRIGFAERNFGSMEANYEWYATWKGRFEKDRIVALRGEEAALTRIDTTPFLRCEPRSPGPGR